VASHQAVDGNPENEASTDFDAWGVWSANRKLSERPTGRDSSPLTINRVSVEKGTNTVISADFWVFVEWEINNLQPNF